jgi:hypothetical protein
VPSRIPLRICSAVDDDDEDDFVFYLFSQKQKNRSQAPYTFRKVRTIRGCLEGLALMILKK